MKIKVENLKVRVKRNGGEAWVGTLRYATYEDKYTRNQDGTVSLSKSERGEFLGYEVEDARGFMIICGEHQLEEVAE